MRRLDGTDAMLLATIVIWAFNITVTRYVLTHGFRPLAYASIRYTGAVILAGSLAFALEGSLAVASPQLAHQDYGLGSLVWLALAFGIVGPLTLTNVLWYSAIERVGPSRATVLVNLQPFLAAIFAHLILSEHIHGLQVGGGALI